MTDNLEMLDGRMTMALAFLDEVAQQLQGTTFDHIII
jgi:hypothetical protein